MDSPVPHRQSDITDSAKGVHLREVAADVAIWLAFVALLQVFRGILLVYFHEQLSLGVHVSQVARCFVGGFRFDAAVASYAVAPLAALSLFGFFKPFHPIQRKIRVITMWAGTLICMLVFVVDAAYFKEYHNQFDDWVFELLFDDRRAIGLTIWKSYPVIWLTLLALAATGLSAGLLNRWVKLVSAKLPVRGAISTSACRLAIALSLAVLFGFGLRGSFGRRPAQLKDAAVCGDNFLDRIVLNPFSAFRYALLHHQMLTRAPELKTFLPSGDIREAAHLLNPQVATATNLDDYLQRTAAGTPGEKPRHVFLIVMESYDAWPSEKKFQCLHLTDQLLDLGAHGIMVKTFLSAGHGTMPSLSALISGLPEVGLHANYRASLRGGLSTAIAPIFKKLGYRTRFFYGGYLSWQRAGDFCREQGFEEVYGGADMTQKLSGNEWGVDDKILFDFILNKTSDEPTFNLVMSTSYHPPYSVNVEAEGFPLKQLPPELAECDGAPQRLHELGHLWYSDRCLGNFVREADKKLTRPVFAMTGDHFSRRCIAPRPTVFERKAIPLVLYGPQVLPKLAPPEVSVGSHLDILPTLIELSAPGGFVYHSFGHNLLDPGRKPIAIGENTVATPDFIFEVEPFYMQSLSGKVPPANIAPLVQEYRSLMALGWWRVMRGNSFGNEAQSRN